MPGIDSQSVDGAFMKRNKTNLGGKDSTPVSTEEYLVFLKEIKADIRNARVRAVLAASREHIGLYWNIGKKIVFRQETSGWGKAIVERLSEDLQKEYPGVSGYSSQNLWYMRQFYLEYRDSPNLQRLVGEIPWGQNIEILSKTGTAEEKEYIDLLFFNRKINCLVAVELKAGPFEAEPFLV